MGGQGTSVSVRWERKAYGRKGWVVRQNGKYARAGVRKEALRQKFYMPRRMPTGFRWLLGEDRVYAQYTRSYVYTLDDEPGEYHTVDVVITEEEHESFSESQMDTRWHSKEMIKKMSDAIDADKSNVSYVKELKKSNRRRNIGGATWATGPAEPGFQDLKTLREKSGSYWAKYQRSRG